MNKLVPSSVSIALKRPLAIRASKMRRPLAFLTETAADALAGMSDDPQKFEETSEKAATSLQLAFRAAREKMRENVQEANSSNYFRVLVFDTESQADAFMLAVGQDPAHKYYDGRAIAENLGISIPEARWHPSPAKIDRRLAPMAMKKPAPFMPKKA